MAVEIAIAEKVEKSKEIIREAYERFPAERTVLAYTGGKDSTLLLWLVRETAKESGSPMPRIMFINEGRVFEEVMDFKARLAEAWGLAIDEVTNDDVLRQVSAGSGKVRAADLSDRNRRELERIGFNEPEFVWEPESYVGNHLMKTAVMNKYLEDHRIEAVYTGIRWDEQKARDRETYFSARENPPHMRAHPILHFTERNIWEATFGYGLPINPLYAQGYRSLGTMDTTVKSSDVPAWEQDLENTPERAGRRQDKEQIMGRLRELGYM